MKFSRGFTVSLVQVTIRQQRSRVHVVTHYAKQRMGTRSGRQRERHWQRVVRFGVAIIKFTVKIAKQVLNDIR